MIDGQQGGEFFAMLLHTHDFSHHTAYVPHSHWPHVSHGRTVAYYVDNGRRWNPQYLARLGFFFLVSCATRCWMGLDSALVDIFGNFFSHDCLLVRVFGEGDPACCKCMCIQKRSEKLGGSIARDSTAYVQRTAPTCPALRAPILRRLSCGMHAFFLRRFSRERNGATAAVI